MASAPSRAVKARNWSSATTSRLSSPVQADMPLPITLVTSFDQRSPQRFSVSVALSDRAQSRTISLARSVGRPCGSPTR
jgi:hypothetical protein